MLKANSLVRDILNQVNSKILESETEIRKLELKLELEKKDLQDKREEARQLEEVIKLIAL